MDPIKYRAWLDGLKAGDKFDAYGIGGYRDTSLTAVTVLRRTASGRIVFTCHNRGSEYTANPTGAIRGGAVGYGARLRLPTPQELTAVEHKLLSSRVRAQPLSNATVDQLREILAILDSANKQPRQE